MILVAVAVLAAASSCSDKARISGTVTGAPDSEVVIKQLSGSSFAVLDTVKTSGTGTYSYKMDVKEGQPEFVYVFKGDTKLASLLLQKGDKVKVVSDTLGNYSVEGSEESEKLRQVEEDFSAFLKDISEVVAEDDGVAASRKYVEYYRSRVKYVMDNIASLTSIPVLYQKVNEDFPIFGQATDAVIFRTVYDSLAVVYPDSRYVKALGKEAERRINVLSIDQQVRNAQELGFPTSNSPDWTGKTAS